MTTVDLATAHHCDTCTCTPVPDLNAALNVGVRMGPLNWRFTLALVPIVIACALVATRRDN